MNLSNDERKTTFSVSASDRSVVTAWSNDPVWQKRLDRLVDPYEVHDDGESRFYRLGLDEITFSIYPKRQFTDEQVRVSAIRLNAR